MKGPDGPKAQGLRAMREQRFTRSLVNPRHMPSPEEVKRIADRAERKSVAELDDKAPQKKKRRK